MFPTFSKIWVILWSKRGFWTNLILAYLGIITLFGVCASVFDIYLNASEGQVIFYCGFDGNWSCSFLQKFFENLYAFMIFLPVASMFIFFSDPWGLLLDGATLALGVYFYVALFASFILCDYEQILSIFPIFS